MYLSAPKRSASPGTSAPVFLFSSAQVDFAPSTCFMLAMQAFRWDAVRAFTKLGIAIAASKPMMATTIMISTRVNPDRRIVVIFIYCSNLSLLRRGRYSQEAGYQYNRRPLIASYRPQHSFSNGYATDLGTGNQRIR